MRSVVASSKQESIDLFFFFNERTQWGESKQSQFENNHQLKVVQIDAKNNESTSDGSSDNKATAETETARHAS